MLGKQVLQDKYMEVKTPANLREKRNQLIAVRYYYYSAIKKLRYDAILESLSYEFFLSVRTIQNILLKRAEQIDILHKEGLDLLKVRRQYPWLCWL